MLDTNYGISSAESADCAVEQSKNDLKNSETAINLYNVMCNLK